MRILLLAFLLLSWSAESQPVPNTPQVQTNQKADGPAKSKEGSDNATSGANNPTLSQTEPGTMRPDKDRGRNGEQATEYWTFFGYEGRVTDWLLACFTLALVVISAIQGGFLLGTLFATQKAANAAETAALVIPKLERSQATVFVNLLGPLVFAPTTSRLEIAFENHGRRAADIGRIRFHIFTSSQIPARGDNLINDFAPSSGIIPVTTKPSDPEFRIQTDFLLTTDEFQRIINRKLNLFCAGIIEYSDTFGERETGWGWCLVPNVQSPGFAIAADCRHLNYKT
jgi:hypothetical protein